MSAGSVVARGERYLSLPAARRVFGVSRRTLYNWMHAGKVEWAESPGGSRYIKRSSLVLRFANGDVAEASEDADKDDTFLALRPSALED